MNLPEETIRILDNTLDGLSEWVILMEPDGTIIWSNRAFTEFIGDATPPGSFKEAFPAQAGALLADFHEIISSGESRTGIQRTLLGADGQSTVIRFNAVQRRNPDGEIAGIIVYGLDITDQIEMEHFKKDAYGQIERNIEQFAILGDHLRNPLTAIIGLCDLLDDQNVASKITSRAREIEAIITRIDQGWIDSEKVRNIIKKYYDIGATGTHELVARAIHEEYIEQQQKIGAIPESNPSMCPWNDLPHWLKDSNLRQAEDMWKKLHLTGCAIGLSIGSHEPLFAFTDTDIEFLAEKEHERWVDEREKKGWVYGRVRNDQERIHHCIVPWEQLPEYQRERDRNAIRALPEILAKVHLKIIRLDES
jgi:hypothetical protein